ncbi:magnesium transporter CorA family protein [uncultured Limnobacter sp.]|uniref:magnesium transporter CorA family protein n=1 Tax=uncultured Limnobacter sp. TaxID=199681 RepID=UPI0030F65C82
MGIWTHLTQDTIKKLSDAPSRLPESGFLWFDTQLDEELAWLPSVEPLLGFKLDELHLEDLGNIFHPSHFDIGDGYNILIIRSLSSKPLFDEHNRLSIKTRPVFFVITPKLLITYRPKDSRTFAMARQFVDSTPKKTLDEIEIFLKFKRAPASTDELMIQLVSNLVDRFMETRIEISEQLDRWQRDLLNPRKRFQDWNALLAARNEMNRLESVAQDQRDALTDWQDEQEREGPMAASLQVNARDTLEHLERVVSLTRRLGSNTETAVQLHFSATAHKTNEIVTVLTMLTALFMPLTLISGIFGMNFEETPLLKNPNGFWISVGLMALSSVISIALILWIKGRNHLGKP